MKKKSKAVENFIASLHKYITSDFQFRSKTKHLSEVEVQREIRPIIISFLENYFKEKGFKDARQKANKSFYWEGQEGVYGRERTQTFGARNYPDFIITNPYLVAVEYKQSDTGSIIKNGIGQSE